LQTIRCRLPNIAGYDFSVQHNSSDYLTQAMELSLGKLVVSAKTN